MSAQQSLRHMGFYPVLVIQDNVAYWLFSLSASEFIRFFTLLTLTVFLRTGFDGEGEYLRAVDDGMEDSKNRETEGFPHWTLLSRVHIIMLGSYQYSSTFMICFFTQ